jgi:hypothetical protein
MTEGFKDFSRFIPQLRDALDRFDHDENFATLGALATACAAIAGEEWAEEELDRNPLWRGEGVSIA